MRGAECPLLAQSGHSATEFRCPLLGVKRTLIGNAAMSASKADIERSGLLPQSPSWSPRLDAETTCGHEYGQFAPQQS